MTRESFDQLDLILLALLHTGIPMSITDIMEHPTVYGILPGKPKNRQIAPNIFFLSALDRYNIIKGRLVLLEALEFVHLDDDNKWNYKSLAYVQKNELLPVVA